MSPKVAKPSPSSLQTEASFQAAVIELAETLGWKVAHFSDSRRQVRPGVFVGDKQAAGFPDLVLTRGRYLLFIELKTDTGRISVKQGEWLRALEQASEDKLGVVVEVWRPSDWFMIERTLNKVLA